MTLGKKLIVGDGGKKVPLATRMQLFPRIAFNNYNNNVNYHQIPCPMPEAAI